MSEPSSRTGRAPVFATVAQFDPSTRSGSALLDDGHPVTFDADAFDVGGLLTLRLGQRVRLVLDPDGHALSVTLSTFPVPGTDPRDTGVGRP